MTIEGKSPEQLEAERQYKESLAQDQSWRDQVPQRERSALFPTDEELEKMAGGESPIESDFEMPNFIKEMIAPSPSMRAAWQKFGQLIKENEAVVRTRQENVKLEREIMGDIVLPLGLEVIQASNRKYGKIKRVRAGYMGQPYYHVQYREDDGTYQDMMPWDPNRSAQLYARDLVNYGLALEGYVKSA